VFQITPRTVPDARACDRVVRRLRRPSRRGASERRSIAGAGFSLQIDPQGERTIDGPPDTRA